MSDNNEKKSKEPASTPAQVAPKRGIIVRVLDFSVTFNNFMIASADWIIGLCGVYVGLILISQFNQANFTVGIALIAIATGLGSSCFGYARAIDPSKEHRDKVVFAGERLLHGAVLALLAAILKAIANNADKLPWADRYGIVAFIIAALAGMSSIILFVAAIFSAIGGLRILSKVLFKLQNRYSEWED